MPEAALALHRSVFRVAPLAPGTMLLWLAAIFYCTVSTLTRVALIAKAYAVDQIVSAEIPRVLLTGAAGYDAAQPDEEGLKNAASIFQLAYALYARHLYAAR